MLTTLQSIKRLVRYTLQSIHVYAYDAIHFYKLSLEAGLINEKRFLGYITSKAHVVEKGLTMPNRRFHFGEENLKHLIKLCNQYIKHGYNTSKIQFNEAINVIFEYESIHIQNGKKLPIFISNEIQSLHNIFPEHKIKSQPCINKTDMYEHGDFKYIATNRHSIRDFCGTIERERVEMAIELAQTAPSACNRQPVSIHIIENEHKEYGVFNKIMSLQNGNRGFGHNADKLLIVSATSETFSYPTERHAIYIDGGIFVMNLLYSLQYYQIAACTLNASFAPKEDSAIKKLLKTKDELIAIIAIGDCPEKINIARSIRKEKDSIINYIK